MALADAEARIALLRERAGAKKSKKSKPKNDDEIPQNAPEPPLPELQLSDTKHINLFEDLEQQSMTNSLQASQKMRQKEKEANEEKGVALAPAEKDRNPWYTTRRSSTFQEDVSLDLTDPKDAGEHEKRTRELSRKSLNDPLTSINSALSKSQREKEFQERARRQFRPPPPPSRSTSSADPLTNRLSRESSERERALELIARRRREKAGMDTPMSVSSVDDREVYGDLFNRQETKEARRRRRGREGNERDRRGW